MHDFAAGCWAATVLTVYWLEGSVHGAPEMAGQIAVLQQRFFWIGLAAIILVMATGAGRTFTYVEGFYGKDAETARRRALIVKHIVLLAIFGAGAAWQYRLAFA